MFVRTEVRLSATLLRPARVAALCVSVALMSGLLWVSPGASRADSHAADPSVKYRQSVMSIIGTHMGAIGDIMKNQLALPGAIAVHATQMAESAQLIAPAFEKRVVDGPTDAKPAIWSDAAKFDAAIASYEAAARDLATAASSGDPAAVGPAMRALGKSCGGCHKPFRKPKEESYKNR